MPDSSSTNWSPLFSRMQPGGFFVVQDMEDHPANVWFIDSTATNAADATSSGRNPSLPFATIDYAVSHALVGDGDVFYVGSGHVENVTAGSIALDVQGISIIGLGIGDYRPTLTFTATDSDIDVDACDILVKNFRFVQGIDAVVAMIDVNADDFTLLECEWPEVAGMQAVSFVDLDGGGANACDNFKMIRCRVIQQTAGADQVVDIAQIHDGIEIRDCVMDVDCENGCIYSNSIHTDCVISGNYLHNRQTGDHAIEFAAAGTGFIVNNRLFGDTAGTILDPGSCHCAGNIETAAINSPGHETPMVIEDTTVNILGANNNNNAFNSATVVGNEDGSIVERAEQIQRVVEQCVVKTDGAVLNGQDNLFDVAGGPVLVTAFVGIVTTIIGGAANMHVDHTSTTPGGDVALSTNVAIDNDAAGTSYTFTAATPGVLTPTTAGTIDQFPANHWLLPIGTTKGHGSAAQTGVIAWYMFYKPLSPASVVTAAA